MIIVYQETKSFPFMQEARQLFEQPDVADPDTIEVRLVSLLEISLVPRPSQPSPLFILQSIKAWGGLGTRIEIGTITHSPILPS